MRLLELEDLLGILLLRSPALLHLVLADDGTGWRFLAYFPLQLLYGGLQGFQLGGGGLALHLQRLPQRRALSGLSTIKPSLTAMFPAVLADLPRTALRPPDSQPSLAVASA